MSKRITKKDAKSILDSHTKHLKERFNAGDYEYLLSLGHGKGGDGDGDTHALIRHLGANIMRINHQLGLPNMTKEEVDEYHKQMGSGFFGDLWNGIKSVGKTVFSIARPVIEPVGNLVGAKYGVPIGTIADQGLKAVGLGAYQRRGGRYQVGGRYRLGGAVENPYAESGQRQMGPEDY